MTLNDLDPHAIGVLLCAPFIGSFLATVAVRLPANEPVVWGRSRCRACGQALGVADLMPVLSWAVSRGRCRHCGGAIDRLHPTLELAALAVAAWAAFVVDGWLLWATCGLGWILLTLAATDLRHYLLPDLLTLPLIVAGLSVAYALDPAALPAHAIGAASGFLAFAALAWLYRRLRGRDGLGLGDAKLAAAAGAWTAWTGLPSVVLWACASAFAATALDAVRGGRVTLRSQIAFGAHLCLGVWLVWLYGPFVFAWQ